MKSDNNCLINIDSFVQIALKKLFFFRLDQPVRMRSHKCMSHKQTVSIATGISNGSCSDALTLLLVIDSFIQKAGLPSIEWPYWALHFPPFKTKRVNKSSLILLFPFVTVSVELPCMPPSGLIIYEWLYSSSVSMNQTCCLYRDVQDEYMYRYTPYSECVLGSLAPRH